MQSRRMFGAGAAAAAVAAFLGLAMARTSAQQPADTVAVDADDIGGVVTGPKGPEAGVWVIAETTDLPTKFVRIVVTDDRGRYLIPDLPKASYSVWVRGYGLVDSPKVDQRARQGAEPDGGRRARRARRGAVLSGRLLVLAAAAFPTRASSPAPGRAATASLPGIKSQGEWLRHDQVGRVPGRATSSAQGDARDSCRSSDTSIRPSDAWERRVAVRAGRARQMLGALNQLGHAARAGAVRRLDRPHRCRRGAAGAAAAAGHRAQRRHHRVGLGGSEGVSARRGVDRSPQSDDQRERPDLRLARAERRLSAGARSGAQHGEPGAADGARSERPSRRTGPMMLQPSPYWGDESLWTSRNNVHNPMFDEQGPRVDHVGRAPGRTTRHSARPGSTHPSAKLFPISRAQPASRDVRSEDEEAHAHQHLLRHASPDVRRGREQHAVDERRRRRSSAG